MSSTADPIDFDALLRLTGQNRSLANELLTMFAQELPEVRSGVSSSLAAKNYDDLEQLVHKLHGSCCYCAANELKRLAKSTEQLIKDKQYTKLKNLISAIEHEIIRVLNYLGQNRIS